MFIENENMTIKCEKCGQEIDGKSPICMYCGATLPDLYLTQETKERLEIISNKKESTAGTSIKAFGAMLIIVGFIADIISMFLIFSADVSWYSAITIFSTIIFLIGIAIVANS